MLIFEAPVEVHQEWRVDCSQDVSLFVDDQLHLILHHLLLANALYCKVAAALGVLDQKHLPELSCTKLLNEYHLFQSQVTVVLLGGLLNHHLLVCHCIALLHDIRKVLVEGALQIF